MPLIREKELYTVEDIYTLPEGEHAELIDGVIYNMAAPSAEHQRISVALTRAIGDYLDDKPCEVYPAPFAVFLKDDDMNYLEPDISVICDFDKISNRGCEGAPDWTIEIVSPSSRDRDYFQKLMLYREQGVREYWIVDPSKRKIRTFFFEGGDYDDYSFDDEVPVHIYACNLRICLADYGL